MDAHALCKYYFLINPAAGKGSIQSDIIRQIRETLPKGSYHIYCTVGQGDGERFAREITEQALAQNQQVYLYACGGDGTFFEVVNGTRGRMPVGVIPCGSGNDFVKNLVTKTDHTLSDINAQMHGEIHCVDLIRCNDRLFANACNVGFDADVAYNMTRFKRLPLVSGKLAYILSIVYCLTHQMSYPLTVQIDDQAPVTKPFLFTAIANGQVYGGSFKGAPLASIHDGLMDVCLCSKISLLQLARFIGAFQKGTYINKPAIMKVARYEKCRRLNIHSDAPVYVALDGDIVHLHDLDIEIMPNALQLIVPQGAALKS